MKKKVLKRKIEIIKGRLKGIVEASIPGGLPIDTALLEFKNALNDSIRIAGDRGKESIIRSQEPIRLFHEVVKAELIKAGIPRNLIIPSPGTSAGELKLSGYFKNKNQDVCAIPKNEARQSVVLRTGMTKGAADPLGKSYTEKTLVVNIRSQMSSIAKNLDTMFERIFAEPLNLHMRCPNIVVGELYLIPVTGYDMPEVKKKNPRFESIITQPRNSRAKTTADVIEKYILAFQCVNKRNLAKGEDYKYERVCLLIADFTQNPIRYYSSETELRNDGLLPQSSKTTFAGLDFGNFASDLLAIHQTRFGNGIFT
jgi:hypothetical protein